MSEPFLGEVMPVGFNFAPRGWAACEGQLLPINNNQALFSLLGTMFGGDGRTTFALPDLRGRVIIGAGQGPGLSNYMIGQKGGSETVTLNTNQIPSHNHPVVTPVTIKASSSVGTASAPSSRRNVLSASSSGNVYGNNPPDINLTASGTQNSSPTGNGLAHVNVPPVTVIYYCIALQGVFPSRN